jgi:hypothetical protein
MHLAYQYGADRIWIVNVGDIKPMELPTSFFLDYAWNPDQWPAASLESYSRQWAAQQFGPEYAPAIGTLLDRYSKYNARRKPELLSPDTYSLAHYREAETVVAQYKQLAAGARDLYNRLPAPLKDAYYQLVLYPVEASANLNDLYVTVARNRLYAAQGRAAANEQANKARALFARDQELAHYYNKTMAGGKWNHLMDQTHISYTSWQQPDKDVLPEVKEITLPAGADMGVALEGSTAWWPREQGPALLPELSPFGPQEVYLELFNRGEAPFAFQVETGAPWLQVSAQQGTVEKEQRLLVRANWKQVPPGRHSIPLTITGPKGSRQEVQVQVFQPQARPGRDAGFVEGQGYVSMEAQHYSRAVGTAAIHWQHLPDLGRTTGAMMPMPVTATSQTPGGSAPHLEYNFHVFTSGDVQVQAYFSPTLNFNGSGGLRYGISIDDEAPQVIHIHPDLGNRAWERSVADNIRLFTSRHRLSPGPHVLKYWMVDPGVVLQKLVVDTGSLKPSYLGPPESHYEGRSMPKKVKAKK